MQRSLRLIAIAIGTALLVSGNTNGEERPGRVVNRTPTPAAEERETPEESAPAVTVKTQEQIEVSPEERQRAAAAAQAASAEEKQIAARLRGLQSLMQKEEQLLAQRLAYANKVREQGLSKNDQKLLDQAEQIERAALDQYQKRCKQFENVSIAPSSASGKATQPTPARRTRSSTPSYRSSSRTPSRR